jgi:hypothetical protein
MPRARPRARARLAATAAALLLAAVAVRCLRRDELHCENAVARLQDCCGAAFPDVIGSYCEHQETGCGTVLPAIGADDADCIASSSCAELVERGICERAASALPGLEGQPGPDLCP